MEKCQFEYEGRICGSSDCVGIARCVDLCVEHMVQVRKDNIRRFNKGMEITKDMTFTKKLTYGETFSKRDMVLRSIREEKE